MQFKYRHQSKVYARGLRLGAHQRKHTIIKQLRTYSHAEAALASRVDVHVSLNRWVVKSLIKGGEGVRGGGNGKGLFLTRNGGLEGKGNAEDGKEGEKREEGASHVDVGDVDVRINQQIDL